MIYKVCSQEQWNQLNNAGLWHGSADDLRDGFIHFSTQEQLDETIRKHFQGQSDLVILGVNPELLGADLRWEPSRGGHLFPHLYAPLNLSAVVTATPRPDDA